MEECTCEHEDIAEHTCPFKADVHNDDETLCSCCDFCASNCADDI